MLSALLANARARSQQVSQGRRQRPGDGDDSSSSSSVIVMPPPDAKRSRRSEQTRAACEESDGESEVGGQVPERNLCKAYMLQRLLLPAGSLRELPQWSSERRSSGWWARHMFDSVASVWSDRMASGLKRKVVLYEGCAGTMAAQMACECIGIPLDAHTVACDLKAHSRQFATNNFKLQHLFATLHDQSRNMGYDFLQARTIEVTNGRHPDIFVVGSPCQPFTDQRSDRSEVLAKEHGLFNVTFGGPGTVGGSVLQTVRALMPDVVVLEQVIGFTKKRSCFSRPPLVEFCNQLKAIPVSASDSRPFYPALHVFAVDAKRWLKISRPRILVLAMSRRHGGADGLEEVLAIVEDSLRGLFKCHMQYLGF